MQWRLRWKYYVNGSITQLKRSSYKRKKFYLRLHKSLYGLKQAPHEWFEEIDKFLKSIGFSASDADPNLYVRREGNTFLLLYINNILLIRI